MMRAMGSVGGARLRALKQVGGWREDALAEDTDLTYRLEASSNLIDWITLAESVAGGAAAGVGLVSDLADSTTAPLRKVVVNDITNSGATTERYVRLVISVE